MKKDCQGMPELGLSARTLGARPGIDVPALATNEMVQPGQGGLSVSPDNPTNLPRYRRPAAFQGSGRDPVWMIEDADLGIDLMYRPDPRNASHGFIEPAQAMTLGEYQRALQQTQQSWRKVTSWPTPGSSANAT